MSDIQSLLKKILTAVYGREVRQSIHDAIAAIDTETTDKMAESKNIAESAVNTATESKYIAETAVTYATESRNLAQTAVDTARESKDIALTASNHALEAKDLAGKIKGGVTLWNGSAKPGAVLIFSIPEECFHNNRTTLTIMVESYTIGSGSYAERGNKPAFLTLCLGTASEVAGTDVGSSYDPYVNKEGYAMAQVYSNVHDISELVDDLNAVMQVKKTADARYSTASFHIDEGSDADIIVVGITAIIFEDLEEQA